MKDKIANTPHLLKYNPMIPIAIAFFATILIATMACGSGETDVQANAASGSISGLNVGAPGRFRTTRNPDRSR